MTDWEKYVIIGTGVAAAYLLLLKPKAKPTEYQPAYPQYEPTQPSYEPTPTQTYEPTYQQPTQPQPSYQQQSYYGQPTEIQPQTYQPTPTQPQPQFQYMPQQIPQQKIIYKKEPIYIEKEIPIPPKLISSPEQKVQQDIDILTERRELLVRLKSLEEQRNKIKDDIINMTIS